MQRDQRVAVFPFHQPSDQDQDRGQFRRAGLPVGTTTVSGDVAYPTLPPILQRDSTSEIDTSMGREVSTDQRQHPVKSLSASSSDQVMMRGGGQPINQMIKQPLRRNQACLQCRRRKLKCDAIRPHCTTCQKSHAHAIRTNSILNPVLVCDFNDENEAAEGDGEVAGAGASASARGARRTGNAGDSSRRKSSGLGTSDPTNVGRKRPNTQRQTQPTHGMGLDRSPPFAPPPQASQGNEYGSPLSVSGESRSLSPSHSVDSDDASLDQEQDRGGPTGTMDHQSARRPPPGPSTQRKRKRRMEDEEDGATAAGMNAQNDTVREEISELKRIIREMQDRMLSIGPINNNNNTGGGGDGGADRSRSSREPGGRAGSHGNGTRNFSTIPPPPPPLLHHSSSSSSSMYSINAAGGTPSGYLHNLPPPPPAPSKTRPEVSHAQAGHAPQGFNQPGAQFSSSGSGLGNVQPQQPRVHVYRQSDYPSDATETLHRLTEQQQWQEKQQQRQRVTPLPAPPPDSPNFLEMLSSAAAIESDKARPSTAGSLLDPPSVTPPPEMSFTYGFVTGAVSVVDPASGGTSNSASSANDASPADYSGFSTDSPNTYLRNAFPSLSAQLAATSPTAMGMGMASGHGQGPPDSSPLGRGPNLVSALWAQMDGVGVVQYELAGKPGDANVDYGAQVGNSFEALPEDEDVGMITDQVLMDILWPGWPQALPEPSLMSHIVDVFFEHVPLISRIFDADTFRSRMALPPTHHNFPRASILHAMCACTARYTARVYTVPPGSEPWRRTTEYVDTPELEPDFGMRHALYAEKAIRSSVDRSADIYEAAQASLLLVTHYHIYSRWLHAWTASGFLNRLIVPLGICDGNRRLVSMLSKPSLLGDWKNDVDREERRNLCWAAIAMDVTSSSVGGWAGTIMLEEVTTPIPSMVVPTNSGNVFVEADQCIQTPDLFKRHPIKTGFNMYMKCIVLVSRINRFTRTWRSRHHTLSPEEGRSSREFADLDSMIGTFVMTFPPDLRDPMKPDPGDTASKSFNLELFLAQILLHQGTISLHEMFADVTNSTDISTHRLLASARGILKMVYLLNATSLDSSAVMPAGFGFYTAARTLLLFLDHAMETGSMADGGAVVLRSEIEVIRTVFEAYGERFPIGERHTLILGAMLDACDTKYGVVSNPGAEVPNITALCPIQISSETTPDGAVNIGREDNIFVKAMQVTGSGSPYDQAIAQNKGPVPFTSFLNQRRGYVNTVHGKKPQSVDLHKEQQVRQFLNRKDQSKAQYYDPGKEGRT